MILNTWHIVKNNNQERPHIRQIVPYSPILINKFSGFDEIKDELISLIDKDENAVYDVDINSDTEITRTDYSFHTNNSREWLRFVKPRLIENINILCARMRYSVFYISAAWYQQYESMSTHGWHAHQATNYSGVFYVEMPKDGPRTEFYDPSTSKTYSLPMSEGDIAIFPAYLPHRSPQNSSKQRKTIISFNIDLSLDPGRNDAS